MIEERAVVVEMDRGGFAWIEKQPSALCGHCHVKGSCGSALLANVLGKRRGRLRVATDLTLSPGDEVIIGMSADALVVGSVAVYLLPLLLMFMGALFAEFVIAAEGEHLTVIGAALGLLGGFLWVRLWFHGSGGGAGLRPVVLKRCE